MESDNTNDTLQETISISKRRITEQPQPEGMIIKKKKLTN
jgi:hypothetical protein